MYRERASSCLHSASAIPAASSGDAPEATSSRQRSSRCCESSSTISASRSGERRSDDNRGRTCFAQSGMSCSRDALDRFHKLCPCFPLLRKNTPTLCRDLVEAAAPLAGLLDPRTLDPLALFKAIEQRVKRIDVELQVTAGTRL